MGLGSVSFTFLMHAGVFIACAAVISILGLKLLHPSSRTHNEPIFLRLLLGFVLGWVLLTGLSGLEMLALGWQLTRATILLNAFILLVAGWMLSKNLRN
jgi:hypothetical protein